MRTTLRALALRQMDRGQSTPAVGINLRLSAKAVWQIGKRYIDGGLERALFDASRPGKAPGLDQQEQQRIIAVVCSAPPEGRARWTVRLLTEEVIKRKLVPRVCRLHLGDRRALFSRRHHPSGHGQLEHPYPQGVGGSLRRSGGRMVVGSLYCSLHAKAWKLIQPG